ncbi:glycosyltransferase family 2 protein [Kutzneria sp. NPDC051319]|uniref:glycosyltransferase n=1 Tax=Kutzneria sp. NPDC051319 TaxID=3155047 RepID=UPI00341D73CA
MSIDVGFVLLALITCYASVQGFVLLVMASRPDPAATRPVTGPPRRISVLVPCFNERKVLRQTVESILASRHVDIARVICVDDGSTDGTIEVMRELCRRHGDVIAVLGQENRGKAAALNHGLTAVDTEFFVAIDADTQVLPDTIASLLAGFDSGRVGAVSGHMLVGNRFPASRTVFDAQVREYEFANNVERRAFSLIRRITVVPGAVGAFRSRAVARLGGYPEGTLAEDAHLTMLLLMNGFEVVHRPSAIVLTEAPDTLGSLCKQRLRWATGKTQVMLKTAGPALRRRDSMALMWCYMLWNHSILPLFSVLGTVFLPVLAVLILVREGLAPVLLVAIAVLLLNYVYLRVTRRFAHSLDAEGRAAAGLPDTRSGPLSTMVVPMVSSLVTWVAWYRVLTGRGTAWNKLDRSGDVRVPMLEEGRL